MRFLILILFLFLSYFRVNAQDINLENMLADSIINFFNKQSQTDAIAKQIAKEKTTVSFAINKKVIKEVSLNFFTKRGYWQIKNIIAQNCYGENDSLSNEKIKNKTVVLDITRKNVFLLSDKQLSRSKILYKIYLFKRFYYCNKIYVRAKAKNFYGINTEFLGVFDPESRTFIFYNFMYIE